MKIRRFDFIYRPLQINVCLSVDGSVPDVQNYDADSDTYTPDYTITPLTLLPAVSRMDKDEILSAGRINQNLANIKWYEIVGGERSLIETTNTDYDVTTSGGDAGRIKIKKNVQPQIPITLEFNAEYTDTRTNQIHSIKTTYQITCKNSTTYIPLLVLDAADQTIYNPLTDADTQTVHASLRLGGNECPTEKRLFVWEVYRDDGTWTEAGEDTTLDYDLDVAADTTSCTVNRSLMGAELYLRCRAKYSPDGAPESVELTDAAPEKIVSFVRRIPKFDYDISGAPVNIPAGLLAIAPEAKIWNTNGPIGQPEKELLPLWYVATNKVSGSLSYSLIGHGINPTLPTEKVSQQYGGVYGLEVKDAGPTCAWEDSDGAVFEDSDGNVILIK